MKFQKLFLLAMLALHGNVYAKASTPEGSAAEETSSASAETSKDLNAKDKPTTETASENSTPSAEKIDEATDKAKEEVVSSSEESSTKEEKTQEEASVKTSSKGKKSKKMRGRKSRKTRARHHERNSHIHRKPPVDVERALSAALENQNREYLSKCSTVAPVTPTEGVPSQEVMTDPSATTPSAE